MITSFRQGIISGQSNFITFANNAININVDQQYLDLSFAFGATDYLFSEVENVIGAWGPFSTNITYWLYWDIDTKTAQRTYGYTTVAPTYGSILPTSNLQINQHFFNTSTKMMMVWNGVSWEQKLRVFAGQLQNNGVLVPNNFGSQVGIAGNYSIGYILYDINNNPLTRSSGSTNNYFVTTEDKVHTQYDVMNSYKIDGLLMNGIASEPIPAYYGVTWKGPMQLGVASYINYQYPCIGISTNATGLNQLTQFVTKGFITNYGGWNWTSPPNTPLFVGATGEITTAVPNQYSIQKIGHIVSSDTIFVDIQEITLIEDRYLSPTPSVTMTMTPSSTVNPTSSPTPTPSSTITVTVTPTVTITPTNTITPTQTSSISVTPTITATPSLTAAVSATPTPTLTITPTPTLTNSPTITPTISITPSPSQAAPANVSYFGRLNLDGTTNTIYGDHNLDSAGQKFLPTADGKLYVMGEFTTFGGHPYNYIARLNSDGSVDTTFTDLGLSMAANQTINTAIQTADGKIYIGTSDQVTHNSIIYKSLIRLNSDGTFDSTFTCPNFEYSSSSGTTAALCQTADGKIYGGGWITTINSVTHTSTYRLNSDGTLDTTFAQVTGLSSNIATTGIMQANDGNIYIIGSAFTTGTGKGYLRLSSSGVEDTSYGQVLANGVYVLHQTSDGHMYIGGGFSGFNGYNYLARFNSDGTQDSTFTDLGITDPVNGNAQVTTIYETQNKIYVSGYWTGAPQPNFIRLNDDGTYDSSYITSLDSGINDFITYNGYIYITGWFTTLH